MIIKSLKINRKKIITSISVTIVALLIIQYIITVIIGESTTTSAQIEWPSKEENTTENWSKEQIEENTKESGNKEESKENTTQSGNEKESEENTYIKWVEFNVTYEILEKAANLDIKTHNNNEEIKFNWIEIISYLATKYGGNFKSFKQKDLDELVEKVKNGEKIEDLITNTKLYNYYIESYTAILEEYIGEYEIETINENGESIYEKKYGIKAFLPIAKNYAFSHYDDFGASRSYGYKRTHLGNDLMGSIGTPIIAVESGIVEAAGWNQYGGWRIGIRSFNNKRYYYYAHLRKNHPFAKDLKEGDIVKAGDVIGYLGMTGYSAKENVNNINVPHLHFGIQLIFNEVQKEGTNQIWIDVYNIINFLKKNKSEVYKAYQDTKDYKRKYDIIDPSIEESMID